MGSVSCALRGQCVNFHYTPAGKPALRAKKVGSESVSGKRVNLVSGRISLWPKFLLPYNAAVDTSGVEVGMPHPRTATTAPSSNGTIGLSFAPQKALPVYLGPCTPPLKNEIYIRWCCIDLSNPPLLR